MYENFLWLMMIFSALKGCLSVRFDYLGVPGSVLRGESVWLDCGYDLQEDELYSVKWYKNNYEFYRYLPSDNPPSQALNLTGVYLDLRRSNSTHVYLKTTDLNTDGTYACEVSVDAPSFRTVRAEKELRIYVMPQSNPGIYGIATRYAVGDEINITCFFGPSKPIAKLIWYINGEIAPIAYVSDPMLHKYDDDLGSVEARLRFTVDPTHLWQGFLSLQCTASLSQVFAKSSEELIIGDGTSGIEFQRLTQTPPGQEGPSITGVKSTYDVGDVVSINCTSPRSLQPADLKWYINDKEAKHEFLLNHMTINYPDGYYSTKLGLKFLVVEDHFTNEEMRLKCTNTLSKIIELTSVESVYGSNQQSSELLHVSLNAASGYIRNKSHQMMLNVFLYLSVAWR